jgi:hypothetical protein
MHLEMLRLRLKPPQQPKRPSKTPLYIPIKRGFSGYSARDIHQRHPIITKLALEEAD